MTQEINKISKNYLKINQTLNKIISKNSFFIDDANLIMEEFHGIYLYRVFLYEWALTELQGNINNWESEHGKSLAFLFENEAQKIQLNELNEKLNESAAIHERDLKMAESLQKNLFFKSYPITDNYDVAFSYQSCSSVSGDMYDFYLENNNLTGILLADVSGHGIASSLLASLAKPIFFRHFRKNMHEPMEKVIKKINRSLIFEIESSEHYLTGVMMRFNNDSVEYINAAHPDVIIKRFNSNSCAELKPENRELSGSILGIKAIEVPFESYHFKLEKNDIMVMYSDCLNESKNSAGEEYGKERIQKALMNISNELSAQEILDFLLDDFNTFTANRPLIDDLTTIIIKKK